MNDNEIIVAYNNLTELCKNNKLRTRHARDIIVVDNTSYRSTAAQKALFVINTLYQLGMLKSDNDNFNSAATIINIALAIAKNNDTTDGISSLSDITAPSLSSLLFNVTSWIHTVQYECEDGWKLSVTKQTRSHKDPAVINRFLETLINVIDVVVETSSHNKASLLKHVRVHLPENEEHALAILHGHKIVQVDTWDNTIINHAMAHSYAYVSTLDGKTTAVRALKQALGHIPKDELSIVNYKGKTVLLINDPKIVSMASMVLPNKKTINGFSEPKRIYITPSAKQWYETNKKIRNRR